MLFCPPGHIKRHEAHGISHSFMPFDLGDPGDGSVAPSGGLHGFPWFPGYHGDGSVAPFLIATGELMEGAFPPRARSLLKYQTELEEMWETERYRKLPPLK